jgi:hypothetical protein
MSSVREACINHLKEEFEKAEMECFIRNESVSGVPLDILTVRLDDFGVGIDDVLGEFLFFPRPNGAPDTEYFLTVITLTGEIEPERIPKLSEYICRINSVTQTGAYVLSLDEKLLMFRMETPLMGLNDEQMLKMTESLAVHAMQAAEEYAGELVVYAEGVASESVITDLLPDDGSSPAKPEN